MKKLDLPGWFGWPSKEHAPGRDWFPGSKLRLTILALLYAFLGLSLTVNRSASIPFFVLAIFGMYIGLRRGFLAGLTRREKVVMLIFASYPIISIISYLLGLHTRVGFRFLGRDLRFLLFIPIFISIRWARPRLSHAGIALATCTLAAFIAALVQHQPWPFPTPHGVAGTHISFGDLSLLSGFLSSFLLITQGMRRTDYGRILFIGIGVFSLIFGAGAATLAHARGAWLAAPFLFFIFLGGIFKGRGLTPRKLMTASIASILVILVGIVLLPNIRNYLRSAEENLKDYRTVVHLAALSRNCVDSKPFLEALLRRSKTSDHGRVTIKEATHSGQKRLEKLGCSGSHYLSLSSTAGTKKPISLRLFRGTQYHDTPVAQTVDVLIRGSGSIALEGRGPWTTITKEQRWKRYTLHTKSRQTKSVILHTHDGEEINVIPVQSPPGSYALALADSSLGQRLLMWNAGLQIFSRHPLLGVGTGGFQARSALTFKDPSLGALINKYEHAHSDYITSLSTKGVLGLISLILLLIAPVTGGFENRSIRKFYFAILLSAGFSVFSITETMFIHSLVIMWFSILTALSVSSGNDLLHEKT